MEKYGFVYIWYDRKHRRYYVGSHWGIDTDGYICSSRWMRKAYRRRPEDFKRRILKKILTNRYDTFCEEQRYLDLIKLEELGKRYYNLKRATRALWVSNVTEYDIMIQKNHKSKIGHVFSEETKKKMSVSHMGQCRPHSEETKIKMSKSAQGHQNFLGYHHSEETKIKMSKSAQGNQNGLGYRHTNEAKQKMRENYKGDRHRLRGP